jgi:hypothetical protein
MPLQIINAEHASVTIDMQEVHTASVDLLRLCESKGLAEGPAAAACLLTAGRFLSPDVPMDPEDEITFLEAILEFAGVYFATEKGES